MIRTRIKRLCLLSVAFCLASSSLFAGKVIRGDANGDGKLSILDITTMIRLLLSKQDAATLLKSNPALDVNKDGVFSVDDLKSLTETVIGKKAQETTNTGSGFSDDDQDNPSGNSGFKDDDQTSPGTEGGGGFKDDDMTDPS